MTEKEDKSKPFGDDCEHKRKPAVLGGRLLGVASKGI
jgi:hypothetical protein